jgi:signal transduction histidine kinase/DNA-binding response OmpR family regulator/sugar lactone lactonase YvrE
MSIYQDEWGEMWLGTVEGINRYDGNNVVNYRGWHTSAENYRPIWIGNNISAIRGDRQGHIFFLADANLLRYDLRTDRFTPLTEGSNISALAEENGTLYFLRHDSLFSLVGEEAPCFRLKTGITASSRCLTLLPSLFCIGTDNGLYRIDRTTGRLIDHQLPDIAIYSLFESSRKRLWIATHMNGLFVTDPSGTPQKADISSNQIREIVEDDNGDIWFGSFDGLWKYDSHSHRYTLIRIPKYVGGLTHPSIFSLYKDAEGTIWAGSYFGGVNYFNPTHERFVHYDYGQNADRNLYYSYIGEMVKDKEGHLWFSTDGGGICCVDRDWNILRRLTANTPGGLPHNNIKSICYDADNDYLFIGTYLGGLARYDLRKKTFRNYLPLWQAGKDVPNEVVYCVKMWQGSVYISSRTGLYRLHPATDRIERIHDPAYGLHTRYYYEHFDISPNGLMYLAYGQSVTILSLEHPEKKEEIDLSTFGLRPKITRVQATPDGFCVATLGAGIYFYHQATGTVDHYTAQNNGLESDYWYNIYTLENGDILFTGDKGLTRYQPATQQFVTTKVLTASSASHIINGCGLYADEKHIYVGDNTGITTLTRDKYEQQADNGRPLFFSELWINNRQVHPGDILTQSLPYTNLLKLKHNQNNLVIYFASPGNYADMSKRTYQYKLEGFDQGWFDTEQPELHYTNLPSGHYTLRLREKEAGGTAAHEASMQIVIRPPLYNTLWAWLLYIVLLGGGGSYLLANSLSKRRLRCSLERETFEKQQIERTNQEKLKFFTSISHEFRTPLTLIMSHIDLLLLKSPSASSYTHRQLLKVKQNASRLHALVSQLLDFRKLEQDKTPFVLKRTDLLPLLKGVYSSFEEYASQKQMRYTFGCSEAKLPVEVDATWMERAFFNLLSNAFKYTPAGGEISVSGTIAKGEVLISVQDSGTGISEEDLPNIFNRFYQGGNQAPQYTQRTGIGLSMVQDIVERHHGRISVTSFVGQGSTFTIHLPETMEEVHAEGPQENIGKSQEGVTAQEVSMPSATRAGEEPERRHTVLLVEDSDELREVLQEIFSPHYTVITATNGLEGLEQVRRQTPDLVISDILMPEMDGLEMCKAIKSNMELCHTPVILLTALDGLEQNIEGLNRGADDYVTKPFNAELLLTRANNLVRNRLLVRQQFTRQPIEEIDLTSIHPLDKELLVKVSHFIETHIDDTLLDIASLSEGIGVGRSTLFTKIKSLTGMTPKKFILNYRLKHAIVLLRERPGISMAELSDLCGFSSSSYFSRCFKEEFGCSPSAYLP